MWKSIKITVGVFFVAPIVIITLSSLLLEGYDLYDRLKAQYLLDKFT